MHRERPVVGIYWPVFKINLKIYTNAVKPEIVESGKEPERENVTVGRP